MLKAMTATIGITPMAVKRYAPPMAIFVFPVIRRYRRPNDRQDSQCTLSSNLCYVSFEFRDVNDVFSLSNVLAISVATQPSHADRLVRRPAWDYFLLIFFYTGP